MRKLLSIAVVALFAFGAVACKSSTPSTPEKTVESFFTTLKAGKYAEAGNFTDMPVFEFLQDDEKQLLDDYFKTMTVSKPVLGLSSDGTIVEVTLKAVDIFTVIQNFVHTVTEMAEAQGRTLDEMSDAELDKMLRDSLKAPDAPKKELTFGVSLRKDPKNAKRWVIIVNDTLRAGLFMQSVDEAYGSGGDDFEIVETIEGKVTYLGGDMATGECKFKVESEEIDMFCHTGHLNVLESDHKNKEINIVYQVVARGEGDMTEKLFVLLDIK